MFWMCIGSREIAAGELDGSDFLGKFVEQHGMRRFIA